MCGKPLDRTDCRKRHRKTLRRVGGLSANFWTSQRWKESNKYQGVSMRRLLKIALVVGLGAIPSHAQRAMSSGHSGGFSVPRGFAPAPHMSGGFNRGGFRSGLVGTPTQRGFNASPTYRRNTLMPSSGVSRPRSFENWHGSPLQKLASYLWRPLPPALRALLLS